MNYFLCSEDFIKIYKPKNLSSYLDRFGTKVAVAVVDHNDSLAFFEKNKDKLIDKDYWARELTSSNQCIKHFDIDEAKRVGLFKWIVNETGASTARNTAAVIGSICLWFDYDPIEFFNELIFN